MTVSEARKLGLKPEFRVALDEPPPGWSLAEPLELVPHGSADVVIAFFAEAAELSARLSSLGERVRPNGAVWVAWPRRAGGHHSDITDNVIREHALPLGWWM
jgi:hypothetical protein